ncbi:Cerebral cavernous malformations protein 2-like protein [Camelus dromedarius]|uniref:Cerebral cavernous malformations protein 2-like protein n=1 Tax=Camelus dromedarius TaxID=9838 RepID=A0A5N4DXA5_CAMDR|nr:Cerebral cavernous malformations protein 2-like protein [Camelus dromedarius]
MRQHWRRVKKSKPPRIFAQSPAHRCARTGRRRYTYLPAHTRCWSTTPPPACPPATEDTVSASHLQDDALHLAVLKSPGPQRFSSPSLSGESSDAAQRYRSAAAWRPGSLVRQVFQTVYVQSTMDFRGRAILERPSTFTHHLSLHKNGHFGTPPAEGRSLALSAHAPAAADLATACGPTALPGPGPGCWLPPRQPTCPALLAGGAVVGFLAPVPSRASSIQEFAINLWQLCMDGLRFLLLGLRPLIPEEGSQRLEDLWNTLWVMDSDHIITVGARPGRFAIPIQPLSLCPSFPGRGSQDLWASTFPILGLGWGWAQVIDSRHRCPSALSGRVHSSHA